MTQLNKTKLISALSLGLTAITGCQNPFGPSPEMLFNQEYFVKGINAKGLKLKVPNKVPCLPIIEQQKVFKQYDCYDNITTCLDSRADSSIAPAQARIDKVDNKYTFASIPGCRTTRTESLVDTCTKEEVVSVPQKSIRRMYEISGSFTFCKRANVNDCTQVPFDTGTNRSITIRPDLTISNPILAENFDISVIRTVSMGANKTVDQENYVQVNSGAEIMEFNVDTGDNPIVMYKVKIGTNETLFRNVPASVQLGRVEDVKYLMSCGAIEAQKFDETSNTQTSTQTTTQQVTTVVNKSITDLASSSSTIATQYLTKKGERLVTPSVVNQLKLNKDSLIQSIESGLSR